MLTGFQKTLAKIFAKKLGKKLEDKTMADLKKEGKPLWMSKTVWAAIFITAKVGIEQISAAIGQPIILPEWIIQVAMALGIYGIRDAKKPLN